MIIGAEELGNEFTKNMNDDNDQNMKNTHRGKRRRVATRSSWSDLPQDILGIIFEKLTSLVDLIRSHKVCRNWHISKDRIFFKDCLPLLCNFTEAEDRSDHIECTIFDPYGRQVFKTLKSTEKYEYVDYMKSQVLGSRQGWLILRAAGDYGHSVFMYNPYTDEIIQLPFMKGHYPHFATFLGNPGSLDCQVLIFCQPFVSDLHDCIASFCLNVDKEWRYSLFETLSGQRCLGRWGMQYMNEQLYCLLDNGILKRYSLADSSWTLISRNSLNSARKLSLIKSDDNVLVACEIDYRDDVCSTFYFDWSCMCWVKKDMLEGSAIFISGATAMVRPLVGDGENTKDCKVFYFEEGVYCHCKCYSFIEKKIIESPEYNWICKESFDTMAFFVEDL